MDSPAGSPAAGKQLRRLASRSAPPLVSIAIPLLAIGCMGPAPIHEGKVGQGTNLWPLLEVSYSSRGRETDVLWPIFAFNNLVDEKYYAVRPLFMIRTDPDAKVISTDILFPIFHRGRTGTRDEFAIRPLFGSWRDPAADMTDIDFLFPIGYYRSEPGKSWFQLRPIVWYKRTEAGGYFHIFPLYGRNWEDEKKRDRYWFLTPLFIYWTDRGSDPRQWSFDGPFPLFHLERRNDRSLRWLFPVFLHGVGKDWKILGISPLFWDYRKTGPEGSGEDRARYLLVLPFYIGLREGESSSRFFGLNAFIRIRDRDEGSDSVLWPLFHHGWEAGDDRLWIFPIFWKFRGTWGSALVIPPFFQYSGSQDLLFLWPLFGIRKDGAYREYSTAYPFFWYGSDGKDRSSLTLLGPLFHRHQDGPEEWSWNFLFPLGEHSRDGSERHSRLFPLYLWWKDETDDSTHLHVLWPLFRRAREKDELQFRLLLPYITYREKGDEHDFRVFWKWIRSTREPGFSTLRVNPFYRRDENDRGDTYWSILGGLFSRKVEGGQVSGKILWVIPY